MRCTAGSAVSLTCTRSLSWGPYKLHGGKDYDNRDFGIAHEDISQVKLEAEVSR
jgi:hypothetical protein